MRPSPWLARRMVVLVLTVALALAVASAAGVTPALAADPTPTVLTATPTPSSTPTTTPEPSSPPVQIGLPDPKAWVGDLFQASLVSVLGALALPLRQTIQGVLDGTLGFVSSTPPPATYTNPLVHDLWSTVRIIANLGSSSTELWWLHFRPEVDG